MSAPIPKLAGVCGWPVHHSLSPLLHSYWLREMKIPGAYVHFAVRPDKGLDAFRSLKKTSIVGVNVTIPLKRIAHDAADRLTPDARRLGVVNCLYKKDGELIGHNTDLEGFAAPLLKHYGAKNIMNAPAIILGNGGASQAVIGALLSLNCPEIRLCGRNTEKSEAAVQSINVPSLYTVPWADRQHYIKSSGLIINASAGGMQGKSELDIHLDQAHPDAFVYDLVYIPEKTGLLRQAEARGLANIGGLDMLIGQARPSFKLFYGQTPPEYLDPAPLLRKTLSPEPVS